jgi:hypothetical protein
MTRPEVLRPELRVILVSVVHEHAGLLPAAAVEAGAEGFVPKEELNLELVRLQKV